MSVKTEEKIEEPQSIQSETDQGISNKIYQNFLKWRDNRNLAFAYFRGRTWIDYINDSNQRFNNYKVKPAYKKPWQANISDTTTHAKLMAVIAQQVVNMYQAAFTPRFSRDIISKLWAQVLQDIYDYTESGSGAGTRNGEIDTLFTILKACREGTVIGFEGYKKTKNFEGIDARFVPIDGYFPSDMTKFNIADDPRKIWRVIMEKDQFQEAFKGWYQVDKVKSRANTNTEEIGFFNVSSDIQEDQVEVLYSFDKIDDEFFVTGNGINLINPNSQGWKLSSRRQDMEDGFWKCVFEAYDDGFIAGRSLPDLMKDGQDGIDFLFNAMFDKEILSVMRPILSGGINNIIDDYISPGEFKQVADINQIKEMEYKGADLTAFRILKELQDRQHFISVDIPSMNVQRQQKTATEVDAASQSAERLNSVFGVMIKDSIIQKARLRAGTIQQYLIKSPKFKQFTIENTKLITKPDRVGTRMVRISNTPASQQKLAAENNFIQGDSEIFELSPKKIRDFEFSISVKAPTGVEKRLKSAKDIAFWNEAKQRPDIFEVRESAKDFAEAMDKDPERMLVKEQVQPEGMGQEIPKENTPPSLQSLISQQIPQTIQ